MDSYDADPRRLGEQMGPTPTGWGRLWNPCFVSPRRSKNWKVQATQIERACSVLQRAGHQPGRILPSSYEENSGLPPRFVPPAALPRSSRLREERNHRANCVRRLAGGNEGWAAAAVDSLFGSS